MPLEITAVVRLRLDGIGVGVGGLTLSFLMRVLGIRREGLDE